MCFARGILCVLALAGVAEAQSFSFGVVADVQYADQPTAGARDYRASMEKLSGCVAAMRQEKPRFQVELGDLVDGGFANFDRILPLFLSLAGTKFPVLGNHDFCAPRPALLKRLGLRAAYYTFSAPGWRFIVLDGMQASVAAWPESDPHYVEGRGLQQKLEQQRSTNAASWNGGLGAAQRQWLRRMLEEAARRKERAIVLCHFPVLAESCRPEHLLWDHEQVLEILEASPALKAWFNGHDHKGGYAEKNGIHYVTFAGMVENPLSETCNVVEVRPDRLVIRAAGTSGGGRTLAIRP